MTITPRFLTFSKAEIEEILSSVRKGDIPQASEGTSSSPISIKPNCLNRWATPVSALYVSLAQGTSGVVSEYMLEFTVAGDSFTLRFPASVRWMDGDAPDWESGYTYQVSILNNMAISAGWPNS